MDTILDLPGPVRELVSRIERLGSSTALATMTDQELVRWIQACTRMATRPGRASSARRTWRGLLEDARTENVVRHARRWDL